MSQRPSSMAGPSGLGHFLWWRRGPAEAAPKGHPVQSPGRIALRRLSHNATAMGAIVVMVVLILMAIAAPLLAPHDPSAVLPGGSLAAPGRTFLFGGDVIGRDVLSRVIFGARISLTVGLISVAIALTLGTLMGLVAGYFGGPVDSVIMRFIDMLLAFPGILLALTIVSVLGPGLFNMMIAVGISGIPNFARLVRGTVLCAKENLYVESARCVGCGDGRIMLQHILPNIIAPITVLSSLTYGWAIINAASLSFLGLGAQPPTAEWGVMLSEGRTYLRDAPWLTIFPGVAIIISVLAANLLGDGLRTRWIPIFAVKADPVTESTGKLVRGRYVVADPRRPETILANGAIHIEEDRIVALGPYDELRRQQPLAQEIGSGEQIVLPGLINAHDHGRGLSTIQMGVPDRAVELWMLCLGDLVAVDPFLSAAYAAALAIEAGITTVLNCQYEGTLAGYEGNLLAGFRGYHESGMRVVWALGILDRSPVSAICARCLPDLPPTLRERVSSFLRGRRGVGADDYFSLLRDWQVELSRDRSGRASLCWARCPRIGAPTSYACACGNTRKPPGPACIRISWSPLTSVSKHSRTTARAW